MKKGRKQERIEQATDRQDAYNNLSCHDKLAVILDRRGFSIKETDRVVKELENERNQRKRNV